MTSKHNLFNFRFEDHEVFKESYIIKDSSDDIVLWINKETKDVSFGGKYFELYDELKTIQALREFGYTASELIEEFQNGDVNIKDYLYKFEKALSLSENLSGEDELAMTDWGDNYTTEQQRQLRKMFSNAVLYINKPLNNGEFDSLIEICKNTLSLYENVLTK